MMQQPSGESQMAQGIPPGGFPPPAPPPGGGGFSGGGSDGGGYGGPPPGGFGGGPPPGGFGGGPPPGGFGGGPPPGGFGGGPPPGGYGGPPGGGPPGGFGGPPGGGAPPDGGGFGGPPGGFGGPPAGGFGGPGAPPGAGGYGPPPGGGYGPPMGAPMGMPGPQQPPPKKSNTGMIIGLGCAGAVVLIGGLVGVGCCYMQRKAKQAANELAAIASAFPLDSSGRVSGDPFDLKPPNDANLKAELKDLRNFKADFGSSIHFVGEIHNSGADPIGYPSAKITFFDATNTAIDSGTCSSMIRDLAPGEKVPCSFSLFKTKTWASYKTEIKPVRPLFVGKAAKLKISDTKFTAKKGYNPHQVEGKITNESAFKAKGVWALVSLYDKDGKICGADNALVAGNDLDSGQGGVFTAKVYNVAGTPDTFRVVAIGYGD